MGYNIFNLEKCSKCRVCFSLFTIANYNHGHNSVVKGQKHRKKNPVPFINVDIQ